MRRGVGCPVTSRGPSVMRRPAGSGRRNRFQRIPMNESTREPSKSHLDVESPKFAGKPHISIQWKGTDVCCDIRCACGVSSHYDGDFFYFFQCPHCERFWEVGTHVAIYPVTEADMAGRHYEVPEK